MDRFFSISMRHGERRPLAEARFQMRENWSETEEDRVEQLMKCVRVKIRMYSLKGGLNTNKGENIEMDFNGSYGDIWTRSKRDRAGDE